MGDKSLEKFRVEYEKLHRALKKSHESEKRLIKRCRELNAEIVANAAKVQTALKLSQEDQKTIDSLKKEIEKAWKMVDASHEKEVRREEERGGGGEKVSGRYGMNNLYFVGTRKRNHPEVKTGNRQSE